MPKKDADDLYQWSGAREKLRDFIYEFESACGSKNGNCIELLKGELQDPKTFPTIVSLQLIPQLLMLMN